MDWETLKGLFDENPFFLIQTHPKLPAAWLIQGLRHSPGHVSLLLLLLLFCDPGIPHQLSLWPLARELSDSDEQELISVNYNKLV